MNNDRELLEMAAKAVGLESKWDQPRGSKHGWLRVLVDEKWVAWDPLTNDGAALQLAVKIGVVLDVRYITPESRKYNNVGFWFPSERNQPFRKFEFDLHICPFAATRRAIVRAAAELGRDMP